MRLALGVGLLLICLGCVIAAVVSLRVRRVDGRVLPFRRVR